MRSEATAASEVSSSRSSSENGRTKARESSEIMPSGPSSSNSGAAIRLLTPDIRIEAAVPNFESAGNVADERRLLLLDHLFEQRARHHRLAHRAGRAARDGVLVLALGRAEDEDPFFRLEGAERLVHDQLQQLVELHRLGERVVDLVQQLEARRAPLQRLGVVLRRDLSRQRLAQQRVGALKTDWPGATEEIDEPGVRFETDDFDSLPRSVITL